MKTSPGHIFSRIQWCFGILVMAFALVCVPVVAQEARLGPAEAAIQARMEKSGADVAVYFKMLDGKSEWTLRPDEMFHAASTMKVPVMIELFHQVKLGKVKLDDAVPIKNEFHSIVDGSVYTLSAADDSEAELYKADGQTRTLGELCE